MRPLAEHVHGEVVYEVTTVGFAYIEAGKPLGRSGVGNMASKDLLAIVQGVSYWDTCA